MPLYIPPSGFCTATPGFDVATQQVNYAPVGMYILSDNTGFTDEASQLCGINMTSNGHCPMWQALRTGTNSIETPVDAGQTFVFQQNFVSLNILLTGTPKTQKTWWLPSDLGMYGVIRPRNGANYGPPEWITSRNQDFYWPPGEYTGAEVTIFDGVTGTVTAYQSVGVPPSIYAQTGGAWGDFFQTWTYNGPVLTFPPVPGGVFFN